jgi:hypothetical protein
MNRRRQPSLCNRIQRVTRVTSYTGYMKLTSTRAAAVGLWVVSMGMIGVALGTTSFVGWTVVATFALVPPVVTAWWWREEPSLSESIHDVLR